jgi:peroxiredoxin Q/BCP
MHISRILFFFFLSISFLSAGNLKIGDKAPAFELKDSAGKIHKLSDYKGKIVALYFYPKDMSSGCTEEACNLRDNFSQLTKAGVVVLGVSFDDAESHKEFTDMHNLPFTLLSDTDKKVAEAYGATKKNSGTPKRITYLIDGEGKILHIFDKVNTANHSAQIMAVINPEKER